MAEDKKDDTEEKKSQHTVSVGQVTAGALGAVTAAALGAQLGVAGTIGGAGLASMISTVGGVVYQRSLDRTKQGAKKVAASPAAQEALRRAKVRPLNSEKATKVVTGAHGSGRSGSITGTANGESGTPARGNPPSGSADPSRPDGRVHRPGRPAGSGPYADPPTQWLGRAPHARTQRQGDEGMVWPGGERVEEDPDTRKQRIEGADATRALYWDGTRYVPRARRSGVDSTASAAETGAAAQRPPEQDPPTEDTEFDRPPAQSNTRRRWIIAIGSTLLTFAIGMALVTGIEVVKGSPLSGGTGSTIGQVVDRNPGSNPDNQPSGTSSGTDRRKQQGGTSGTTSRSPSGGHGGQTTGSARPTESAQPTKTVQPSRPDSGSGNGGSTGGSRTQSGSTGGNSHHGAVKTNSGSDSGRTAALDGSAQPRQSGGTHN